MSPSKSEDQPLELVKLKVTKPYYEEEVDFEKELFRNDYTSKVESFFHENQKPIRL